MRSVSGTLGVLCEHQDNIMVTPPVCIAIQAVTPNQWLSGSFSHGHQSICLLQTFPQGILFQAVMPWASGQSGKFGEFSMIHMGNFKLLKGKCLT